MKLKILVHVVKLIERVSIMIKVAGSTASSVPALVEFSEKLLILEICLSNNVGLALLRVDEGLAMLVHQ